MGAGAMVRTMRVDVFFVEIRHPGRDDWNHIHTPDWEDTPDRDVADDYAGRVRSDHPGSDVRVIRRKQIAVERINGEPLGIIECGVEIEGEGSDRGNAR